MPYRPKIRPDRELQPKREVKRHDPFSEKDKFLRENSDLVMDMREVRMLFALREDGVETKKDLAELSHELAAKLEKQYADPQERTEYFGLLADETMENLASAAKDEKMLEEFLDEFTKNLAFAPSLQEQLLNRIQEGKERVASLDELFTKVPFLEADLKEILDEIKTVAESADKQSGNKDRVIDYLSEVKELNLPEEIKTQLFKRIGTEMALAWGHDQLIAESMGAKLFLLNRLGYGTNAETYLALDHDGEESAVKILSPRNAATRERVGKIDRSDARQLMREIAVLKEVKGDYLVEYRGGDMIPNGLDQYGEPTHEGWIALEYLDGGDLNDYARNKGAFSLKDASKLAFQIAKGLQPLHEAGIVHRDIKPDNIMIDTSSGEPVAKVIDLGTTIRPEKPLLADTDESELGAIYGTPLYMAGEATYDPNPKTDIFAVGVLLFQLLSKDRVHPYVPKEELKSNIVNQRSLMIYNATGEALQLSDLRSDIPPEMNDFIMRMIDQDPAKRPDANEVAQFFSQFEKTLNLDSIRETINAGDELDETRRIPGYGKSLPTISFREPENLEPTTEEESSTEELAESIVLSSKFNTITKTGIKLELAKLNIVPTDEEFDQLIETLKEKNLIRQSSGRNKDNFVIVRNFEDNAPNPEEQAFEEPRLSLKEAKAFFRGKPKGRFIDAEMGMVISQNQLKDILTSLENEGFVEVNWEEGTYKQVQPKSIWRRLTGL